MAVTWKYFAGLHQTCDEARYLKYAPLVSLPLVTGDTSVTDAGRQDRRGVTSFLLGAWFTLTV